MYIYIYIYVCVCVCVCVYVCVFSAVTRLANLRCSGKKQRELQKFRIYS